VKIYTRTGDQGETSLFTGQRVRKDALRVETYGTVDEIGSALALARALCANPHVKETVYELQKMLMLLMADLASVGAAEKHVGMEQVKALERMIDRFDAELPPLKNFIVPGDTPGAAALDLARTVARRAERQLWRLSREEAVDSQAMIVLNRLSDLCFVLSRAETINCQRG